MCSTSSGAQRSTADSGLAGSSGPLVTSPVTSEDEVTYSNAFLLVC